MHDPNARRTLALIAVILVGVSAPAPSQSPLTERTLRLDDDAKPGAATLADLAWLTGRWVGEGLGGRLEESWAPPTNGSMLATFRLDRDAKPNFYELCALVEVDGSVAYHVKHFHPDMRGWEEKDETHTFRLVKVEADAVYFHGLTLVRDGDVCRQYLAMGNRDGSHREMTLEYRRAETSPPEPARARPVAVEVLAPLLGSWTPADQPARVVHRYDWSVGRQSMRLREGVPADATQSPQLEGTIFGDPATGEIDFVAVGGPGEGQGRLFRGGYRVLDDGRIERVYTVTYRTPADTPGESLGGITRRYREVYTVDGDRLDATLDWWRDGTWQPFGPGRYSLVRRPD